MKAYPRVRLPSAPGGVAYVARLEALADERGDEPAVRIVDVEREAAGDDGVDAVLSWRQLDKRTNQVARLLSSHGVGARDVVAVVLPNQMEHLTVTIAAWKLGACVLAFDPSLSERERTLLFTLAEPALVVSRTPNPGEQHRVELSPDDLAATASMESAPLPLVEPLPAKVIASSSTTGDPKLILDLRPWREVVGGTTRTVAGLTGMRKDSLQLIVGPLYSGTYFNNAYWGLFHGDPLVIMSRFDARVCLDLVQRYRPHFMTLVPTMMLRMARLHDQECYDL